MELNFAAGRAAYAGCDLATRAASCNAAYKAARGVASPDTIACARFHTTRMRRDSPRWCVESAIEAVAGPDVRGITGANLLAELQAE